MIWDTREPMGDDFLFRLVDLLNRFIAVFFTPIIIGVQAALNIIFWWLFQLVENIVFFSFIGLTIWLSYRIFFPSDSGTWSSPYRSADGKKEFFPEEKQDEDPLAFWKSMTEEKGSQEWNPTERESKMVKADIAFLKAEYEKSIDSNIIEAMIKAMRKK